MSSPAQTKAYVVGSGMGEYDFLQSAPDSDVIVYSTGRPLSVTAWIPAQLNEFNEVIEAEEYPTLKT